MKKNIKQSMQSLLRLPVKNDDDINELRSLEKKKKNPSNSELIALRLFEAARKGEMSALKEVLRLDSESESVQDIVKIIDDLSAECDS